MFRKQWICTILFAKIFERGRGVLWLQVHYFYFDKVLLYKQEKLIANIFIRPLLGLLSSFRAIWEGRKYSLMLLNLTWFW